MLIFENHGWQISSDSADTNYLEGMDCEQPKWVVHDNSDIAAKVMSTPYWEAVEDEKGQLVDIIPTEPPVTDEDMILSLKDQLEKLDRQAIRPLRAIAAGTDTEEDRKILKELEKQAAELRQQLDSIETVMEGGDANE